jgi:hypothetical protein
LSTTLLTAALLQRHLLTDDDDKKGFEGISIAKGDKDDRSSMADGVDSGKGGKDAEESPADDGSSDELGSGSLLAAAAVLPVSAPGDDLHPDDEEVIHAVDKLVQRSKEWKDKKGKEDKEMLKDDKEVKDSGKDYNPDLQIHDGKDKPEGKPDKIRPEKAPKPDFDKENLDKVEKEKQEKDRKEKICRMRKEKREEELDKAIKEGGKEGSGKQVYVGPDCYCEPENPACGDIIRLASGFKRKNSGRMTGAVGAP